MSWDLRELAEDAAAPAEKYYSLSGEVIILYVSDIAPTLLNIIVPQQKLDLDLSGISEIDGAGIQLLLFAKEEAQRRGSELVFTKHSEPMLEIVQLFGLGQALGRPDVQTWEVSTV